MSSPPIEGEAAIAQDHGALLTSAQSLLSDIREFRGRFRETRESHAIHYDFVDRALSLEGYLSSSLSLAFVGSYMPAFALLRSALEHQLVDQLLFLARRYKRRASDVERTDFDKLHQNWKAGTPGTETITRLRWISKATAPKGTFEIVRTGVHMEGGKKGRSARALSIYYGLLKEYDPFVGSPDDQRFLVREYGPLADHKKHAEEQRRIYYGDLKWEEIKSNLRLNRMFTETRLRQLNVHYRFLSACVHPWPAATNLVYGRARPRRRGYDHYASELLLLYIVEIAAAELTALGKMATRTPRLKLAHWRTVVADIKTAKAATAYFWYPGGQPHDFDRVKEANARMWYATKDLPTQFPPKRITKPDQLKDDQIGYYRNPFRRVIQMHIQGQELMGFTYVSLWPRADAQQRLIQS
jgi:hypothetical protein